MKYIPKMKGFSGKIKSPEFLRIQRLHSDNVLFQEIINDFPAIEPEDIKACLAYASRLTKVKSIHKVVA
ncbi:MAG: DUF433 domain-containing protein [Bacteroidetes bacterium]|nr:DUF433 domain-containing protein [Bacteroidota bacterium]